jgi:ERCC4-related helicase
LAAELTDITGNLFTDEIITRLTERKEREIRNEEPILELLRSGNVPRDGRFCLNAEANILQLAYANNKILSLSNSRTSILAHQVESTHRIVNSLNQRFILADEVGLGKTIEAGLVIKELVFRYKYSRILIVAPASLLVQWQCEMEEKFSESFDLIDRKTISRLRREFPGDNPWMKIDKGICSIDFIKSDSFAEDLKAASWDAVIIDEAHRMRRDAQVTTRAYNVGEILSDRTHAFLLLTATPFRGKLEELFFLVRLADKNLLGPYQSFYNDYCMPDADLSRLKDKLATILIRRTKKEVGGYTSRHARTIRFDLYPEERALYDATTRYVAEEFNRAMQTENRAVGFVMTVFQKLLDSSSYALCSALRNRKIHLEELLSKAEQNADRLETALAGFDFSDPDFFETEEPDEVVNASVRKTASEIKVEILTIEHLIRLGESVARNKKGEKLIEMIHHLKNEGYDKFLIFTQFRTTQDYLLTLLQGYRVAVFNGSMDKDQKEDAIIRFKGDDEILICTEAGGEGRNMQFCSILFNYDLPWSPLKIEQRIGRLHRFGQKYDVGIYNFSTKDTVAERVLDVLTRKLQLFEDSIGTPDIMLGQIEDEVRLTSLFMDMTTGRAEKKAAEKELDSSIQRARASYEKLSELAVARRMDFNYNEYYRVTQKDRVFSNKQLESFVSRAAASCGEISLYLGSRSAKTGLFPVRAMPGGKHHHPYGTFDSARALADPTVEFLAFGHSLVDYVISRCQSAEYGGMTGVQFIRHDKPFSGMVFYYRVTYTSLTQSRELIPVVVEPTGRIFSFEQERLERICLRQTDFSPEDGFFDGEISRVLSSMWEMNRNARERISEKVEHKVWDMREQLDLTIDPEIEKIRESCDRHIAELSNQLERQENHMRLFDKDMRGAITRTRNKIADVRRDKEHLLAQYRRRLGIQCSIELVCAGVLIALPENTPSVV